MKFGSNVGLARLIDMNPIFRSELYYLSEIQFATAGKLRNEWKLYPNYFWSARHNNPFKKIVFLRI